MNQNRATIIFARAMIFLQLQQPTLSQISTGKKLKKLEMLRMNSGLETPSKEK